MKELHLSAMLNGVKVEVEIARTGEGKWSVVTDFCKVTGGVQWGTKRVGSNVKAILVQQFQQWLETDKLESQAKQVIGELIVQFELAGNKIQETKLEPEPRTVPLTGFNGTPSWLPKNRGGKYVRLVKPKSHALDIKLYGCFAVGSVSKRGDLLYADIIVRESENYYKVDKFLAVGKDLTAMMTKRLGVLDESEIGEVKQKCQAAITWINQSELFN